MKGTSYGFLLKSGKTMRKPFYQPCWRCLAWPCDRWKRRPDRAVPAVWRLVAAVAQWRYYDLAGNTISLPRSSALIRRLLTVLVAPGGTGKSILSIHLALMLASGKSWGGFRVRQRQRVLIMNVEDDHEEMFRRIYAAWYGIVCQRPWRIFGWFDALLAIRVASRPRWSFYLSFLLICLILP